MTENFKIYTKTGDKGETALIGGQRVMKNHPRIEAYGDIDELKSWIGFVRDQDISIHHKRFLLVIQDRLFTIESHLASPDTKNMDNLPAVSERDIEALEIEMDRLNDTLPALSSFILPGGCINASLCHVGRTICRRAERRIITLTESENVDYLLLKYVNRLSDYLFVLARALTKELSGTETPWIPKR